MTVDGFTSLESLLSVENSPNPQVYIHEDKETGRILRIGKATNGVLDRWIKNTSGHACTFLWAIGKSHRYQNMAIRYPHYLAFFAGLHGRNTLLHVLTVDPLELSKTETKFRHKHCPVWEYYLRDSATKYLRTNKMYVEAVAELGGAIKIINNQRAGLNPLPYKILDVVKFMNSCPMIPYKTGPYES